MMPTPGAERLAFHPNWRSKLVCFLHRPHLQKGHLDKPQETLGLSAPRCRRLPPRLCFVPMHIRSPLADRSISEGSQADVNYASSLIGGLDSHFENFSRFEIPAIESSENQKRSGWDSNPRNPFGFTSLAKKRFRPLSHRTKFWDLLQISLIGIR
jgi:hypothetical protein